MVTIPAQEYHAPALRHLYTAGRLAARARESLLPGTAGHHVCTLYGSEPGMYGSEPGISHLLVSLRIRVYAANLSADICIR